MQAEDICFVRPDEQGFFYPRASNPPACWPGCSYFVQFTFELDGYIGREGVFVWAPPNESPMHRAFGTFDTRMGNIGYQLGLRYRSIVLRTATVHLPGSLEFVHGLRHRDDA